jgi:hypothetical protein
MLVDRLTATETLLNLVAEILADQALRQMEAQNTNRLSVATTDPASARLDPRTNEVNHHANK